MGIGLIIQSYIPKFTPRIKSQMAEIIRMPRLSDTMEEGNIVGWLKKVGDKVSPGDILAEVETDKATMELESFHEGYLLYISVKEGPVPVNEVLAVIGEKGEDYQKLLSNPPAPENEKTPAEKKSIPENEPQKPQPEQVIEEPQTLETEPAPQNGPSSTSSRIKSSPLAKSIAAEAGIDLATLKGTGDGGRIIKRDVESFVAGGQPQTEKKATPTPAPQYGEQPLSQMRKTIARRLVESKFSAPHFYLTIKINMDKAADARKLINDQSGLKISFNDFIVKACAIALKQHPAVNSSWMGDKIRINKDINIGVAVAVDEGLLVPVLFGTDKMGLSEINTQVTQLAEKARQKKLQPQEMQGNTFTVSNLGMFGIDEFTAIINPPDSGILAVGTIADELSMVDDKVISSKIMKVTMSCDHRVIDGATGARFLQTFKQYLENPVAMLV
jgi:pyruvate dehydrogenase E2 component (dihydrolipoamide acetyltransferase)